MAQIEDHEWAVEQLEEFIERIDAQRSAHSVEGRHERLHDELLARLPVIVEIARRIDATYVDGLTPRGTYWGSARSNAMMLLTELERASELRAKIGPSGPQMAAEHLHPWVWGAAHTYWESNHYRQAVAQAAEAIDSHLQDKLQRRDVSGADLATQAFRTEDPDPGDPRLRHPHLEPGSKSWKSFHAGAMHYGRGCFMVVRNLATHDIGEMEQQKALEQLAALSVLARMLDEADVINVASDADEEM